MCDVDLDIFTIGGPIQEFLRGLNKRGVLESQKLSFDTVRRAVDVDYEVNILEGCVSFLHGSLEEMESAIPQSYDLFEGSATEQVLRSQQSCYL